MIMRLDHQVTPTAKITATLQIIKKPASLLIKSYDISELYWF